MAIAFEEAAIALHIKKEKLAEEGLKAYLRERLRGLRVEIIAIYLKYGVASLTELDEKINSVDAPKRFIETSGIAKYETEY